MSIMRKNGLPWYRMAVFAPLVLLTGCVSFGGEAPPTMLVLEPAASVPAGAIKKGDVREAIVINVPDAPRKLETNRVAVQIDRSNIAYLKNAVWADKPALLLRHVIAETVSARSVRMVLPEADAAGRAETVLTGQLLDFGIDAAAMEVVAAYDGVLIKRGQPLMQRRFEVRIPITRTDAQHAGPVLNEAANNLAGQIADWLGDV